VFALRSNLPPVLVLLGSTVGAGCSGTVGRSLDGGVDRGVAADVASDVEAAEGSVTDPCAPGSCRFHSDPSGPCLPPGGPVAPPDSAPELNGCCECGSDGFCAAECVCASPDTPIATPGGERSIESLRVGDLVLSVDRGRVVAVPIRQTRRTLVTNHRVIEVALDDGVTLHISAAHPTADGRSFGQLHAGDWVGGRAVTEVKVVPYEHDATYDILPDSDTGTYFAGGALIGSTLEPARPRVRHFTEACALPFPR